MWRKMDKDKGKGQVTEVIKVKVHCTLGETAGAHRSQEMTSMMNKKLLRIDVVQNGSARTAVQVSSPPSSVGRAQGS